MSIETKTEEKYQTALEKDIDQYKQIGIKGVEIALDIAITIIAKAYHAAEYVLDQFLDDEGSVNRVDVDYWRHVGSGS
jgi:hypothetical protein